MSQRQSPRLNRRKLIKTSGALSIAGLAGCSWLDSSGDDGDPAANLPSVQLFDSDGNRIEPTLFYDQESETAQQQADEMERNLERIGVNLQTEGRANLLADDFNSEPLPDEDPEDFEYAPGGYNAGPPDRTRTVADWDMLIGIGANSYPRTPGNTDAFWYRDSPTNAYGYVPEVDMKQLYSDFRSTTDEEEKQSILNEIMGALTDEVPANFISQNLYWWGFQDDINVSDQFNEYGMSHSTINRYRDDQSVGGDFIWLSGNVFDEAYLPEQESNNSAYRTDMISDGAYGVNSDDEVVPYFLDIEDTGDAQVYVCTLRDNLQYGTDADGNEYGQMTAEDWVYHLRNVHGVDENAADMWNEETPPGQPATFAAHSTGPIENVEETGELEFQIELDAPDGLFPFRPIMWGAQCYPMELYESYAPDAEALRQSDEVQQFTWTGNLGPYTFEDRQAGQTGSFTVTRNDEYYMREHTEDSNVQTMDGAYADAPYFETYQFNVVAEESTRVEQFRNGEGDRMELPTQFIEEFQQDVDSVNVEDSPDPYISFMFFNQRSNGSILTRERDGRRAAARVIDKETINQQVLQGFSESAVTFQPTWSNWYDESAVTVLGIDITEEDVVTARDLLRENENFTLEEN